MQNKNLKRLILLFGAKQSGKDTAGAVLKEAFPNAKCFAFADELKQMIHKIFGVPLEDLYGDNDAKNKLTTVCWKNLPLARDESECLYNAIAKRGNFDGDYLTIRELLIVVGTDIFRKMYDDCWVQATWSAIVADSCETAIITDGRFPNELASIWDAKCGGTRYPCDTFIVTLSRNPYEGEHKHDSENPSNHLRAFLAARHDELPTKNLVNNYLTDYAGRLFLVNNATIGLEKKSEIISLIAKRIKKGSTS